MMAISAILTVSFGHPRGHNSIMSYIGRVSQSLLYSCEIGDNNGLLNIELGTASQIWIKVFSSYYKSNQIRNLLIGAIAGAYEAATSRPNNCWNPNRIYVPGPTPKWCHAPVQIAAYTEGLGLLFYSAIPTILTRTSA
jgi:hypothetical protein